jgi:hypothetical protein
MAITAIAFGMFLAQSVVPSSGSSAMSTFGPGAGADLLADEQHRRLVALALADHHRAVDRQLVELAPHGVDRRLVGGLLVAAPAQPRRGDRRALGHAHEFERQDALEHLMRLDGDRRRHAGSLARSGRLRQPQRAIFSIRINCGSPDMTLSALTASSALRTASSVVA